MILCLYVSIFYYFKSQCSNQSNEPYSRTTTSSPRMRSMQMTKFYNQTHISTLEKLPCVYSFNNSHKIVMPSSVWMYQILLCLKKCSNIFTHHHPIEPIQNESMTKVKSIVGAHFQNQIKLYTQKCTGCYNRYLSHVELTKTFAFKSSSKCHFSAYNLHRLSYRNLQYKKNNHQILPEKSYQIPTKC